MAKLVGKPPRVFDFKESDKLVEPSDRYPVHAVRFSPHASVARDDKLRANQESRSLRLERKFDGRFHLKLNIKRRPIANK